MRDFVRDGHWHRGDGYARVHDYQGPGPQLISLTRVRVTYLIDIVAICHIVKRAFRTSRITRSSLAHCQMEGAWDPSQAARSVDLKLVSLLGSCVS